MSWFYKKQKRPAHLSIVERLGGFSCNKDTNNHWQHKLFRKKDFKKVYSQDITTKQMLLIDYHQTEWCPREGVQNAKVSLLYRQATYRKFRWQKSGWHTYEIRHRRPLVSRQDILTHSIVKTWRENNQSVRTYQHTKRKHFSILSSPPHNEVTRPKDNGLYSLTRSKKYWQNFFIKQAAPGKMKASIHRVWLHCLSAKQIRWRHPGVFLLKYFPLIVFQQIIRRAIFLNHKSQILFF